MDTETDVRVADEHAGSDDPLATIKRAAGAVDARKSPELDPVQQEDATEWLLSAFDTPPSVENLLTVNVGGVGPNRKEIPWRIKAIPGQMIRKIRDQAETVVRRQGNTGAGAGAAGFEANVRIVIEGTIEPNIREVAKRRSVIDPADVLEIALNNKQGLIEQIAGSILTLSGYDQEDVQDALEVRAAGNS